MYINFDAYQNKEETINYEMDVKQFENLNKIAISKINSVTGKIKLNKIDSLLKVDFELVADIIAISSYSLKEFGTKIPLNDELYLSNKKEESSQEIVVVDNLFDLDELVYSLLISTVPLNIHEEGESLPKGDGYSVLSEEEYEKEKEEFNGSLFDILKDLDL